MQLFLFGRKEVCVKHNLYMGVLWTFLHLCVTVDVFYF